MKGMDMRIHKLEYLIAGVLFLSIGLFGTLTDRTQTLFIFYVLGLVFLVIGITRFTTTKTGRRHS
jgi:uncharacterized membrane protein HdeD (DUF308 family)